MEHRTSKNSYRFNIHQAQDEEFGLEEHQDRLCVIFESGDPGGDPGDFEKFFSEELRDWFDADITVLEHADSDGCESEMLRLVYSIEIPEEHAAGLNGANDTVTVILASGDPGGDSGDFADFIRVSLVHWMDGGRVRLIST